MITTVRTILCSASIWVLTTTLAFAFQSEGKALIILDHSSGIVLFEKNADMPLPPASMSKIMTVYMVFEALQTGQLSLEDKLSVSKEAASYGGSTMFLTAGERVSVEDLLRGVIVLSGNDASAVLAEALSPDGTEAGFARLMTERGRQIGLTNSVFANSNGWPDPNHQMSVRDLAVLSSQIIKAFPNYYLYFAEQSYEFDNRVPANSRNRNPLLGLDFGADGLKTGYTREAGYGIVGSVKRNNRRVVFVLAGLKNRNIRANEAERIAQWYFVQFKDKTLFTPEDTVVNIPVWMGDSPTVKASVDSDAIVLMPANAQGKIEANAIFDNDLEAPISKGQEIGMLEVQVLGFSDKFNFPLVAQETLPHGGFIARFSAAVKNLIGKTSLSSLFGL